MNDKCAGGTGAVIDKINAKLKIPADELCEMGYDGLKLHPVAGKCGVFAETDINGLQKQGVPPDELMASLFESIIQQNLVGAHPRPHAAAAGAAAGRAEHATSGACASAGGTTSRSIWKERKRRAAATASPVEELIVVPENAQYFAAIGAVEFAKIEVEDDPNLGVYQGTERAASGTSSVGRVEEKKAARRPRPVARRRDELRRFKARLPASSRGRRRRFAPGTTCDAFVGLDGGSTSTKAVLIDEDKNVIAKAYQLSKGNPIEDTMEIFAELQQQIDDQGCTLEVLGVGTTGYAKDILKDVLGADVALVETVAHTAEPACTSTPTPT